MKSELEENRWSQRKELKMPVELDFEGKKYRCRTRDIGLGGMFVELGIAMIPPHSRVNVEIVYFQKGEEKRHEFKAAVAHGSIQGYGLEFKHYSIDDFRVLQNLLQPRKINDPGLELIH